MVTTILTSNKEITSAYFGTFYKWTHMVHTLLCLTSFVQYYFCKIYPCCWSSYLLTDVQDSIRWIYQYIFFWYITDDPCLVSIWGLCATMNILMQVFWLNTCAHFCGICLVIEILGHKVCVLVSVVDNAKQHSKAAAPIYMPISSVWEFPLLYISPKFVVSY